MGYPMTITLTYEQARLLAFATGVLAEFINRLEFDESCYVKGLDVSEHTKLSYETATQAREARALLRRMIGLDQPGDLPKE